MKNRTEKFTCLCSYKLFNVLTKILKKSYTTSTFVWVEWCKLAWVKLETWDFHLIQLTKNSSKNYEVEEFQRNVCNILWVNYMKSKENLMRFFLCWWSEKNSSGNSPKARPKVTQTRNCKEEYNVFTTSLHSTRQRKYKHSTKELDGKIEFELSFIHPMLDFSFAFSAYFEHAFELNFFLVLACEVGMEIIKMLVK